MIVLYEDLKHLSDEMRDFIIDHGAFNCCLVKLDDGCKETLFGLYGEDYYDESDISVIDSFMDGNWHFAYEDNGDYFICGDDNLLFTEDCLSEITDDFSIKMFYTKK